MKNDVCAQPSEISGDPFRRHRSLTLHLFHPLSQHQVPTTQAVSVLPRELAQGLACTLSLHHCADSRSAKARTIALHAVWHLVYAPTGYHYVGVQSSKPPCLQKMRSSRPMPRVLELCCHMLNARCTIPLPRSKEGKSIGSAHVKITDVGEHHLTLRWD